MEAVGGTATEKALDVDLVIREVLGWLSIPSNKDWLLIFDNVDRERNPKELDEQAYDVSEMLPDADHGSVLITSRLGSATRLGSSLTLGRINEVEGRRILEQEVGARVPGT